MSEKFIRSTDIILRDGFVEEFIVRARERGFFDELEGNDNVPFFEDEATMNHDQRILYGDRTVEDAVATAYANGREYAKNLDLDDAVAL